jgi:hypothetical protein
VVVADTPAAVVGIPVVAVDTPVVGIASGQRRCRQRLYGKVAVNELR